MLKPLNSRMRLLFAAGLLAVLLVVGGAAGLIVLAGGVEAGTGTRIVCLAAVCAGVLLSIAAGLLLQRSVVRPLRQAWREAGGVCGDSAAVEARRLRASLDEMNHSLARIGQIVGAINDIGVDTRSPTRAGQAPQGGATVLALDAARERRRSRAPIACAEVAAAAAAAAADDTSPQPARRHDADAGRGDT
ncbi:hypothetical protein ACFOLJ_23900 [Rugamonas sp. CCM 8940]|uniref:hypothetical protein n=1 Tax=Rugamonas sp. CCM 8940 TaxID=2765359 RepID=UPI0018F3BD96|nr:hypothetical protein [Rugamonas sp. CCM 8940]MBJ7313499.1 hypothetical protein [Rugamonas sp. CCM 8940]